MTVISNHNQLRKYCKQAKTYRVLLKVETLSRTASRGVNPQQKRSTAPSPHTKHTAAYQAPSRSHSRLTPKVRPRRPRRRQSRAGRPRRAGPGSVPPLPTHLTRHRGTVRKHNVSRATPLNEQAYKECMQRRCESVRVCEFCRVMKKCG